MRNSLPAPFAADINPDRLLEHCPELEDELLALSPAFAKLKNPILRRTVAKVATLCQAAGTGEIPVLVPLSVAGYPPSCCYDIRCGHFIAMNSTTGAA